ncbi:cell division cycle protein 20 homolog [Anopheles ziemanni]|uniref:cell division cycle protein 20 homolog n=1 Tax=Anopheles coustani TaxID=139045 RepID=UPI002659AEDD|nr:cell division cycle protein 20 homolog [Anopheles coustani]XP_058167882.1 cell division cycle protein 20 homolog [Anopheles ziemanni]
MAQFNYLNEMNSFIAMDGEITKGPVPRWQKKLELSAASTSFNNSALANTSARQKLSISFTGNNANNTLQTTAGFSMKSPRKNGGKNAASSAKKPSQTPSKTSGQQQTGGDRFIPSRTASDFARGNFIVKQSKDEDAENEDGTTSEGASPKQSDRMKSLSEALGNCDIGNKRVLSYQVKPPPPPEGYVNPLKVVYSAKTPMSAKSGSRYIPNAPERILDAPEIVNDYYLNLMDWSGDNVVAVALGPSVYLWNAATGTIETLFENEGNDQTCSLSWISEGHILAVGTNAGTVELWDCENVKRLRVMNGHSARVGVLAWNSYVLCSGSRDGTIVNHDVRTRQHNIGVLQGHTQEVCGLKWSPDGKYLASGGNDNLVNVWAAASGAPHATTEPVYIFNQHQAAIRALAWCPWQSHVLASGGGTADRCIKFWNCASGQLLSSVDTKSQVCGLIFSKTYKELISAHGYVNNQLSIWKYPSMTKQVDLMGHTGRVLQIAMSPDGSTIMSAGADETLRMWNCFAPDPLLTKKEKMAVREKPSLLKQSIR